MPAKQLTITINKSPQQQHQYPQLISINSTRSVDHILHTFSFEILLPHIVAIPPEFDIKISAIDVNSDIPPKCFDLLFISLISRKFTSWQDMFSLS
jgi:hypothetical protein